MTLDNRMHWIECEIRHEQQPGVHTYHLCPECETNQCRSVKCAACWTRDLDRLRPHHGDCAGEPVMSDSGSGTEAQK